jgi:ribonucleoside-diphosphate reductase beta chain
MSIFDKTVQYRPFKYPKLMELAVEQNVSLYWHEGQVDLSDDIRQFHTEGGLATENVSHESNKNVLIKVLNLFTQMDIAAGELYCQLLPYVGNNEVRNWFMAAANKEGIHQRAYALIVEELGFPESTWSEFMEYDEMQKKIDLMTGLDERNHSNPLDFAKTLSQLLLAEGICLFGAFSTMLNQKRFGKIMGTNDVNEWSLRDEERHVEGNIIVLKDIISKNLNKEETSELFVFIQDMVSSYVEAEHKFIDLVFEVGDQEGMTKEDMKGYISYLGQLRLNQLGFNNDVPKNPLGWMDYVLSGKNHTNFFESKVTDYDHEGLLGGINYGKYAELVPTVV